MTAELPRRVVIDLPDWAIEVGADAPVTTDTDSQMRFVLDLARRNVAEGTGGPFAAAVFRRDTGAPLAIGVNRVVPLAAAPAHAEIVAIALAGQAAGSFDVGDVGSHVLVSSTEPCAMCLGAVPWSGVDELVIGARDEDARAVGFDEGIKPDRWPERLAEAGIEVRRDVLRDEAAAVLRDYAAAGGPIYNGTTGDDGPPADGNP